MGEIQRKHTFWLYSVSLSPGSDVAYLPNAVLNRARQVKLRTHKNKVCVHTLTSYVCVFTSLPGDDETEYSKTVEINFKKKLSQPSNMHNT